MRNETKAVLASIFAAIALSVPGLAIGWLFSNTFADRPILLLVGTFWAAVMNGMLGFIFLLGFVPSFSRRGRPKLGYMVATGAVCFLSLMLLPSITLLSPSTGADLFHQLSTIACR